MLVGYARVSTQQQETALQQSAFVQAGVLKVYEEKRSAGGARPVLEQMLSELKEGDVLVVYKIDRLARSLVDLLRILERLGKIGATFRSLTEPLETLTPVGRMMLQLLGAVAEFERAVIRERCEAGRRAARDRGVEFGRPPLLRREEFLALVDQGLYCAEAARVAGITKSSMKRCVRRFGVPFRVDGRQPRPAF